MRTWYDKWRDLVSSVIFYALVGAACLALVEFGSKYKLAKVDEQFREMEPKIAHGEYARVNRRICHPDQLHYTDIIMYRVPMWKRSSFRNAFARVVGLPGDVVEVKDHVLYRAERRDGKLGPRQRVSEPYLRPGTRSRNFSPFVVPRNCVFALYDERSGRGSLRDHIIPARSIRGRVIGK